MTKEELREHCEKQVKMCEEWAKGNDREPSGKIYEEHKLILELLEQQPSEDCISIEVYKQVTHERDIAIEQLRELGYEFGEKIRTSEDCVSRAEVRKIAKEMYLEVANMDLDIHTISDCISYTSSKCRQVLEDKLQDLPPVTPIAAIATVQFNKEDLREICKEQIEIACEHITCRDCKYWIEETYRTDNRGTCLCFSKGITRCLTEADFYCKDFKKRGNEKE